MQATPRLTRSVSKALSAMGQTGELTQDLGNLIAILSITSELQSAPAKLAYMLERVTVSESLGLLRLVRRLLEAVPSHGAFTPHSSQDWKSHQDWTPSFCILRPLFCLIRRLHHQESRPAWHDHSYGTSHQMLLWHLMSRSWQHSPVNCTSAS